MTPARHQQIGELFHAALDLEPAQRAVFLAQACDGNESLRREVESLLASHEQAADFIAAPALAVAAKNLAEAPASNLIGRRIGHYQVLSLLGAGGVGEVYLAQDARLGRQIALKLLSDRFTQDAERVRRFEQEARAASALNHPNILTIHEIGETDGAHYIVTEFIDGQTLRQRMKTVRLKVSDTVEVAAQVASALAAAHEAGIIHRDIKPENVMARPDGLIKVLDFGLAKLTERPTAAPQVGAQSETKSNLSTEPGVVMGTASYMSPEQARGQKVDHRTDIFSLGVMLYELVGGRRPFEGATMSDVIATLLTAEPPPLRHYCAEAPSELERIIAKCLSKDREARYQSAKEMMAELKTVRTGSQTEEAIAASRIEGAGARWTSRRGILIAAIAAALIVGLAWFNYWRRAPAVLPVHIKSLAVLPLENLSGDPAQEYFADGMTETLISNLSQIHAFDRVISRTSVMRFKGSRMSLPEIAAELKVDAVIEATVQRSGGRVRITVRLIPAATDSPVWTREYERDPSDVLKLQSDVARAVADEIRIQVTPEERARLTSVPSINPEAHDEYLLGRFHIRTNEDDLRQAIEHFNRAIQLEPKYAAAYAGLSRAWGMLSAFGAKNRIEAMSLARDAASKAVALGPQLPETHIALGHVKTHDWEWTVAEQELARALELDQNNAHAHQEYAELLMTLGRHDEAIREIARAEQLDPLSSIIQSRYGRVLYRARKYEEAAPHLQRAMDLDPSPGNSMPYWILGELYVEMDRYDEAIDNFKKYQSNGASEISDVSSATGIARVYARMGKTNKARRILEKLKARTDPSSFLNAPVARAYAELGDKDEAFKALFRQVEARNNIATYVMTDPPFKSLHSDPRWKELLRRMNFPTAESGK